MYCVCQHTDPGMGQTHRLDLFWRHVDRRKTNICSKIHGMKVNRIIEDNMYSKCLDKSNS